MEKLKDIVLIGFAIVGFISILSGFTQEENNGTPESHAWQSEVVSASNGSETMYALNKITGEVRSYKGIYFNSKQVGLIHRTSKPVNEGVNVREYVQSLELD